MTGYGSPGIGDISSIAASCAQKWYGIVGAGDDSIGIGHSRWYIVRNGNQHIGCCGTPCYRVGNRKCVGAYLIYGAIFLLVATYDIPVGGSPLVTGVAALTGISD